MPDLQTLIQSGSASVWLYVPVAILLGALHGLEPGHSKTMMAAFVIAIRGTVWQAVLLGLSAAISHSLLIWVLAALALNYGSSWNAQDTEPYFQMASAALIFGLALWMFYRTRREVRESHAHSHRDGSDHGHSHPPPPADTAAPPVTSDEHDHWQDTSHSHTPPKAASAQRPGEVLSPGGLILPGVMEERRESENVLVSPDASPIPARKTAPGLHGGMLLDTGHGWLEISVFETNVPPRFRIYPCKATGQPVPLPKGTQLGIETARLDGSTQKFKFEPKDGYWEATSELPEPHEFLAVVSLGHSDHAHTYKLRFSEDNHGHSHGPAVVQELEDNGVSYQDAHERAHAQDIARRFGNRTVTTPQIVLFGITGGLMPCPAAFTILLVCLQVKRATLGFALVGAFSFGLALTMVAVGAVAAWSVHHAQKRFTGFGEWMRRAPYISCGLLILLAAFMAWSGWQGLHGHQH
jgi:nickel/cobalt exporter